MRAILLGGWSSHSITSTFTTVLCTDITYFTVWHSCTLLTKAQGQWHLSTYNNNLSVEFMLSCSSWLKWKYHQNNRQIIKRIWVNPLVFEMDIMSPMLNYMYTLHTTPKQVTSVYVNQYWKNSVQFYNTFSMTGVISQSVSHCHYIHGTSRPLTLLQAQYTRTQYST